MEKNIVNPGILNKITNNSDAIAKLQNGLAYIVGNTNATGSTLSVGQYVYVKGHSTIAEGLRKVTSSISNGGSITTNNTEACSEGGLNALNSKNRTADLTSVTNIISRKLIVQGWHVILNLELSAGINGFVNVATLPADLRPNFNVPIFVAPNVSADSNKIMTGYIGTDGKVNIRTPSATSGAIYASAMWAI